jgi:heme/copper-type cytochrome/quinol oxidase subunit 2
MKKYNELIAVILVILSTVGAVLGIFAIEKFRRTQFYTAELIARTTEHGNFYPDTIVVPYNQEVRILIRNIDTVSHGFALPAFNAAAKEIKAGEAVAVSFKADKKGTFPFHCTVWCSERHMEMGGELVVK